VAAGTGITNTAWISQSTLSAAVTTPEVLITVRGLPELVASKDVDPIVPVAGGRLTYTIQVANVGNITTTEVTVSDPIPDDTEFVPGSDSPSGIYESAGNLIHLVGATLGPGQSLTVTFAVTVNTATEITNTAYITGDGEWHEVTVVASPAAALARIEVLPSAATLAPNEAQQFTAVGYDADDNVVDITPTWTADASAGTISATGMFTAGTVAGVYTDAVIATADGISATAVVTITSGALDRIDVSPSAVTLAPYETQQFDATGYDAYDNMVAITPSWTTDEGAGTISATGMFTAGITAGVYSVIATEDSITGTAVVTVAWPAELFLPIIMKNAS